MWWSGRPTKSEIAQGVETVVVRDSLEFLVLRSGHVRIIRNGVPTTILPGELVNQKRSSEILSLIDQSEIALSVLKSRVDALRFPHVHLLGLHRCRNHTDWLTETKYDCRDCSHGISYGIFYPCYGGPYSDGLSRIVRQLLASNVDDDAPPEDLRDLCRGLADQFQHCSTCNARIGWGTKFCGQCGTAISLPQLPGGLDFALGTFVSSWAECRSFRVDSAIQCLGPPLMRDSHADYQGLPQMLDKWPSIESRVHQSIKWWSDPRLLVRWLDHEWYAQQERRREEEQEELEREEDEAWVERQQRREELLARRRKGY